jgi:hypothetical protein
LKRVICAAVVPPEAILVVFRSTRSSSPVDGEETVEWNAVTCSIDEVEKMADVEEDEPFRPSVPLEEVVKLLTLVLPWAVLEDRSVVVDDREEV